VVGKSGPKLTPASDTAKPPYVGLGREGSPTQRAASYYVFGTNASMTLLADRLQGVLSHPVLNETGISGNFDFRFDYSTTDTENDSLAAIYTSIQEGIGLKLESGKGPIEVLVIDNADKPTEN